MEVTICSVCAQEATRQYMTVAEAARILTVSKMTVYRLIDEGHLKGVRIGRQFRIQTADFDAYRERIAA